MSNLYSLAIGVGTKNSSGEWLEVFYPAPILNPEQALSDIFIASLGLTAGDIEPDNKQLTSLHTALNQNGYSELAAAVEQLAASSRPVVAVLLTEDSPPSSAPGLPQTASAVSPTRQAPWHRSDRYLWRVEKCCLDQRWRH